MKKLISLLLAVTLCLGIFSGCTGQNGSGTKESVMHRSDILLSEKKDTVIKKESLEPDPEDKSGAMYMHKERIKLAGQKAKLMYSFTEDRITNVVYLVYANDKDQDFDNMVKYLNGIYGEPESMDNGQKWSLTTSDEHKYRITCVVPDPNADAPDYDYTVMITRLV